MGFRVEGLWFKAYGSGLVLPGEPEKMLLSPARHHRLDDCRPWRGPHTGIASQIATAMHAKVQTGLSPGDTTGRRLQRRRWPPECTAFVPGLDTAGLRACIVVECMCHQTEGCQSFASDAAFVTFRDRRHAEFSRGLRYSESLPAAVSI